MKRFFEIVLGALALIGALLAAGAATKKTAKADAEDLKATELRRNNRLRAASVHASKSRALRGDAEIKRQKAEQRVREAANRESTFADVATRFNSELRNRRA